MSKRAYKAYTKEFKVEAIRLAAESDKPVTQVARELGVRVNQIYKWRKQLEEKQDSAFSGRRAAKDKDAEIRRLKNGLINTVPAPEATEANRSGTVCDLAMPGEGAPSHRPVTGRFDTVPTCGTS